MRRKRTRQIRPTLLLYLVVALATVAILFGVVLLAGAAGKIAAVVILVTAWILGLELGLLPEVIERYALWRARRSDQALNPMWFVDERE